MNSTRTVLGVVFLVCVSGAMISSYAMRWMIDAAKVRDEGPKLFRQITPPRRILTPLGLKLWWTRWIVLAIGLVAAAIAAEMGKRGAS